jgi:hypothetical protein
LASLLGAFCPKKKKTFAALFLEHRVFFLFWGSIFGGLGVLGASIFKFWGLTFSGALWGAAMKH